MKKTIFFSRMVIESRDKKNNMSCLTCWGIWISLVCVLVAQLYLTLCDTRDCSLPGSSVLGILQARILEWVAIPFSRGSSHPRIEPRSSAVQVDSFYHLSRQGSLSSVRLLSCVRLFVTPWIAAHQVSLSIINSWSSLKLTSTESVIPSCHLILCCPFFLLPPIPPSIKVFSNDSTLSWGGQSIGVSALASFLPKNTQGWSPLGWTGWTSLQSKGLSRVFSNTTVQKHQFFGTQLSSQSNSHIHTWPLEKP